MREQGKTSHFEKNIATRCPHLKLVTPLSIFTGELIEKTCRSYQKTMKRNFIAVGGELFYF